MQLKQLSRFPWLVAGTLLLLLGSLLIGVFVPLVLLGAFQSNSNSNSNSYVQSYLSISGAPRVAVRFNVSGNGNGNVFTETLAMLDYSRLALPSSNIHLLSFASEPMLQTGVQRLFDYADEHDDIDIDFIVREFNYTTSTSASTSAFPNDPFFGNHSQMYLERINISAGWTITTGSDATVVVAVIDTGIDIHHPDLRDRLWINPGEVGGNGIDDDENGYIDDVHGYDFAGKCKRYDERGTTCIECEGQPAGPVVHYHGTHVAGIIGATQNNGIGISGVSPHVRLMVLRVSDCTPEGRLTSTAIFEAFDYAYRMGANIVSCSFGNNYPPRFHPMAPAPDYRLRNTRAYQAAMQPLADKGVLIVAAAGNEDIDLDNLEAKGFDYAPCLVDLPTLICVGATDDDDNKWQFSNYGRATVHVGSPGLQVYSTYGNASYAPLNGTSMATPMVTGEAALLLHLVGRDGMRGETLRSILLESADYRADLPFQTRSRINVGRGIHRALAMDSGSVPTLPTFPCRSITGQPGKEARTLDGWDVTYHEAAGNLFTDSIDGKILGHGSIVPSDAELGFRFFDTGLPTIVRLVGGFNISTAGLWEVTSRVRDSPQSSMFVYIDGVRLLQNRFVYLCRDDDVSRWLQVEVRIAHPTPWGSFTFEARSTVTDAAIDASHVIRWIGDGDEGAPPAHLREADLARAWRLSYATEPAAAAAAFMFEPSGVSTYPNHMLSLDLGHDIVALNVSAGAASAHVKLDGWYRLDVTCNDCVVYLGRHVIQGSRAEKTKCVPFRNADKLTIRFVAPTPLLIRYAPCDLKARAISDLLPLPASRLYQWQYWNTTESNDRIGWVDGMQCSIGDGDQCWTFLPTAEGTFVYHASDRQSMTGTGRLPLIGIADQTGLSLFDRSRIVDATVFGSFGQASNDDACVVCDPVRGVSRATLAYPCESGRDGTFVVYGFLYTSILPEFQVRMSVQPCEWTRLTIGGIVATGYIHAPIMTQIPVSIECKPDNPNRSAIYYDVETVGLGGWDANLLGRPLGVVGCTLLAPPPASA